MRTHRCPVLVWRAANGPWTAALVEEQCRAAVGDSPRAAIEQLRALREWQYRNQDWIDLPDLTEPELRVLKVPVRSEYVSERTQRRYPVQDAFELRTWLVTGLQSGGMRLASFPMFDLRVLVSPDDDLDAMLRSHVRRWFEGSTPEQLSRFIPPDEVMLQDMFITLDGPKNTQRPEFSTSALSQVADPLGDSEVRGFPGRAWERDRDVHRLSERLLNERSSLLMLGPHGSGKTTVLADAVRHVERLLKQRERRVTDSWMMKPARRFWQTSAGRLISGMKYLGQWQERLEEIIRQLNQIDGVLCVDSLSELLRIGGQNESASVAAFCLPYLQRGELRIITEATPEEFDICRRLLPAFTDLFQIFPHESPGFEQTNGMLNRLAEREKGIVCSPDAGPTALRLFRRFEPYHALPGQVTDFWKDLFDQTARTEKKEVNASDVLAAFLRRTGLPERFLRDDQLLEHSPVLVELSNHIIGQPEACTAMADVIIRFKAAMNDARRPLAVMLFCGPTGVGKTELAKAAAKCLFGGADDASSRLIRLDMSEYSGPWAADRLLVQSNGEPSPLIQSVRRQPFSVLLLDEIEKAHPDVFDVLMNVFDEGRLTDRFGRVTWFRSTVILMTSNLGTDSSRSVGFGSDEQADRRVESAIRSFFRPEFFNRMDTVLPFHALSAESIRLITEKELQSVIRREGLARRRIQVTWDSAVVDFLARSGFDVQYGARPLQRAIETHVTTPLARCLVDTPDLQDTALHLCLANDETILCVPRDQLPRQS
ncbi:MAG: ATP-dependent Clp protease ATP-binding subunit [Planctomycetaceae bacterium]|nr:ATP-dependent Clp protease ATP-binding subunit [Planctomycetaceae bacterium]